MKVTLVSLFYFFTMSLTASYTVAETIHPAASTAGQKYPYLLIYDDVEVEFDELAEMAFSGLKRDQVNGFET